MKFKSFLLVLSALFTLCLPAYAVEDPPQPEIAAPATNADAGLVQTLESHRWTLASATHGENHRIEKLFPPTGRPFMFTFSAARLSVQGGCNSFTGGYQVNPQGMLQTEQLVATQMACAPELMNADSALAALLAQPLQIEFVPGVQPTLRLLTASKETLALEGQLTPEALYGPGTQMFLEVDAQRLTCRNPHNGETTCLQVREISFDEQGLRSGPPGPWRPFYETIEGYSHTSGVRNVLRVQRFQRGGAAAPAIYVLDLIVESEQMPEVPPWQRDNNKQ